MNIEDYGREITELNSKMLTERAQLSPNLIGTCNQLLRKAKDEGDTQLLGYAYYYLADAYYLISTDNKKFNLNLLKAIELLQTCGDLEHLARCYNLLGIDALSHGNPELALDFYLTGLKYCEEMPTKSSISGFLQFNIGQIYFDNGDIKSALAHIRAAYKGIRRNKKDSLYFRNLLYCYCFQADCYILLDKKDSVEKCLQGINQLEQDRAVSREYFLDLPVLDILMRGFYYLGEMDLFEKYADMLSVTLQNDKIPLDGMEDTFGVCRFLMGVGRVGEVTRIIKNIEISLTELNIPNLKKGYAKLKIEFYEKMGKEDKKAKAYEEFFTASMEQEKESIANHKFFLNMRNRLAVIEKENSVLQKQAETDSLTGLGNRYSLNKFAEAAFEKAYAGKYSLAVELLDVDNFKYYNDTYGHQAGDQCLKRIADSIIALCRSNEGIHAFRYGGDEFVIIYEDMTDEQIMSFAMGLRNQVAGFKIRSDRNREVGYVTISQGIRNSVPKENNKLWDYMYAADNALYEVKDHKKGEVVLLHDAVISKKSLDKAQHS
ncbi:GGDEF domain-containing protein [Butyrivibrio sp. FCS014]|uniref:GGDEF domain-containing protein n=1 Tax=Butyrivibrio sp. FCS014 TaxID=1408304 RepID=UPI0004649D1C|nr:GGDEF domain-containing protein [Butyrivibrio sp. FCS014]